MTESAPLAMSVETFAKLHAIGRTTAYYEIKAGRLRAAKVGKRTLITAEAAADWRRLISQQPSDAA
ncbi:MAG: helix-turn-helix domain-containing protein [Chromatiales bacterium]|jgi:excisionase family DNA binding protein|nr:helix-turn-helix domain-containing protein [Chromatiales bacterium]